jgi:hypothetical protein
MTWSKASGVRGISANLRTGTSFSRIDSKAELSRISEPQRDVRTLLVSSPGREETVSCSVVSWARPRCGRLDGDVRVSGHGRITDWAAASERHRSPRFVTYWVAT